MGVLAAQFRDKTEGEAGLLRIHLEYTSGASGAIPTTLKRSNGIASVVRTGAGVVVLTLNNPAQDFMDFVAFVEQATPSNTGACHVTVVDSVASSPGTVTITFRKNSDYSVQDTASGDVVYVSFSVKTSTV